MARSIVYVTDANHLIYIVLNYLTLFHSVIGGFEVIVKAKLV